MNITIRVAGEAIEMPGATTAEYAAIRAAEALGHDVDDRRYAYQLRQPNAEYLPAADVIADYDGQRLELYQVRRPPDPSRFRSTTSSRRVPWCGATKAYLMDDDMGAKLVDAQDHTILIRQLERLPDVQDDEVSELPRRGRRDMGRMAAGFPAAEGARMTDDLVPKRKRCWWMECEDETPSDDVFCVAHRDMVIPQQDDGKPIPGAPPGMTPINTQGQFQSEKHPELPPGKIVLAFDDPPARSALAIFGVFTQDEQLGADVLTACGATHNDDGPYRQAALDGVESARNNLTMALAIHGLDSMEPVLRAACDTLNALLSREGRSVRPT